MGIRSEAFPGAEECLAAAQARRLLENGRVMLWRPEAANGLGPIWLGLPVPMAGDCLVLAMIGFAETSATPDANLWGPPCPERAPCAWGQAVADRLRAQAGKVGGFLSTAGAERSEVPLFDRLARRLRVSDPPERFQRLAASRFVRSSGLRPWRVGPRRPVERVVVAGEVAGLTMEAIRARSRRKTPGKPSGRRTGRWARARPGSMPDGVVVAAADSNAGWFVREPT